jgi:hypothetical protein
MAMRKLGFVVLYQPNSRIRHHQGGSTKVDFRVFLINRNRLLFLEKWGAALENQEPYESDSPDAVERALARAEIFADQCGRKSNMVFEPSPRPKFNATEQDSRCVEKSQELKNAYAAYQTQRSRSIFSVR